MTLNVLVIDDDSVDRETVRRVIPSANLRAAATGAEGLALLKQNSFDCVLLDYRLPDMDGVTLLRAIYDEKSDLPPVPVVMLAGLGSEAVMEEALRWGAQDYILKENISPESMKIVMAKARALFNLKRERNQSAEQLRLAHKMEAMGQLTTGVAHDFNNLLTIILGNTRLLHRRLLGAGDAPPREELVRKIEAVDAAAQRGADLVKRLMLFTRQQPTQERVVDVNACVRNMAEILSRTLGEPVELKTILAPDLQNVRMDSGQFENALINIAVNARDAMPQGGKLVIETKNDGASVVVTLTDTGHGMKPEVARKIFDPFFTTKPHGTGLGLSMVYNFVLQCGGTAKVESEQGRGAVFHLALPAAAAPADAASPAPDLTASPRGGETILVVEDDPDVRDVVVKMLRSLRWGAGKS